MRDYILTPGEKQIIKRYLENGERLEGFYVLLHRARKQKPERINEEMELIKQFLIKAKQHGDENVKQD